MTPLRDQHGNLRGYAKIMRDLTEKKLAEDRLVQSEHRFNRLLEANIIGIGITSADGRIKQANGEYLRILGYTRDELEAGTASWADRTPTEHLDLDDKAIAEALSMGACTPYEKEYSRYSDERRVPVLIAFAPLDESKDFIVYVLDLTERKRMEQNLRRANESKDDFIAMLGHELRNPLSPVLTSVHILQSTTGPEKFRDQALSMIERQVKHMTRLVDDLLEVARISKGKFNLKVERLELSFLVTRAIETTRPFIDSRRHRLSVTLPEESIWLRADAVRFEQLLTNLLNNAAKYTEPGGQITVVAQREGGEAVICIRDTGIGIDAATLSRLFVPFSQAEESIGRSMGGLGVGLSLVKKIAELHGGSVHAHSMGVGHGSEFIVRMPIDQAAAAREDQGALEQETHRSMPLRVLVVDDNIDAADSLRMLLELDGHEVVVAHSGPAAVKTAVDWGTPDVILLDIGLPEMDGYQVALTLRSNPQIGGSKKKMAPCCRCLTGWLPRFLVNGVLQVVTRSRSTQVRAGAGGGFAQKSPHQRRRASARHRQ